MPEEHLKKIKEFQQIRQKKAMQKQQSLMHADIFFEQFSKENNIGRLSTEDRKTFINIFETLKNNIDKDKQDQERKMLKDGFRNWLSVTRENKQLKTFSESHPKICHFINQVLPEKDRTEMEHYLLNDGWSQSLDCIFIPALIFGISRNEELKSAIFVHMFLRNKKLELPSEKKIGILIEDITDEKKLEKIHTEGVNLIEDASISDTNDNQTKGFNLKWSPSILSSRINYDENGLYFYKNNFEKKHYGAQICTRLSDMLNNTIQTVKLSVDDNKPYILDQLISGEVMSYGEPHDQIVQYVKNIVTNFIPKNRWEDLAQFNF